MDDIKRDSRVEQWLKRQHIGFELIAIQIDDDLADVGKSLSQVRLKGAVDTETVERYTRDLEAGHGDYFPPLLVAGAGPYRLLDGHQRTAAFRVAGRNTHWAYRVLTDDPNTLDLLAVTANNINGLPPSKAERVQQALRLVRTNGYSFVYAAEVMLVGEAAIRDADMADKLRKELKSDGLPDSAAAGFSMNELKAINRVKRRPTRAIVASFVASGTLTKDEREEMTKLVRAAEIAGREKPELERWERIAAERAELPSSKAGRRAPTRPFDKVGRALDTLGRAIARADAARLSPTEADVYADRVSAFIKKLAHLEGALRERSREGTQR